MTQPILVVIGDKPGGFGAYRDGFEIVRRAASKNKELLVVKGQSHYDLYDKPEAVSQALSKAIPFFKEHLGNSKETAIKKENLFRQNRRSYEPV